MTRLVNRMSVLSLLLAVLLMGGGVSLAAGPPAGGAHTLQQVANAGVFGWSAADWEANGFVEMGSTDDGYRVYEAQGQSGFAYYVGFDGNVTVLAEIVILGGAATFQDMEDFVQNTWLPPDAQVVDEFAGVLVDSDSSRMAVQIYYSDTLFQQGISRSGTILVTYGGPGGNDFDRVSVSIGT